jgi:predicted MFS family arabinose efflux permease
MKQRSVYSAAGIIFFGLGSMQISFYYIPIWFQVIKGVSPEQSGILFLHMVLGNLVGAILFGGLDEILPFQAVCFFFFPI